MEGGEISQGWFREKEVLWPGQARSLAVEEVFLEGRSDFQYVKVFKSKTYVNILTLGTFTCVFDGVGGVQMTYRVAEYPPSHK